jgi:hypothetical protein
MAHLSDSCGGRERGQADRIGVTERVLFFVMFCANPRHDPAGSMVPVMDRLYVVLVLLVFIAAGYIAIMAGGTEMARPPAANYQATPISRPDTPRR